MFGKLKRVDEKVEELKLKLKLELGMPEGWVGLQGRWSGCQSLSKGLSIKWGWRWERNWKCFKNKRCRRKRNKKSINQEWKRKWCTITAPRNCWMSKLSLGLNFGITLKKFPLAEYVQATELLCQRLEEGDDDESVEKARAISTEVYGQLKRSNKLKIKSNLSPLQRKLLWELMDDHSIIISPADKEKAVVVEVKIVYLMKTKDQVADGDYEPCFGTYPALNFFNFLCKP